MDSLRAARARVTLADFEERHTRRQKAKRAGRRLMWTMIAQYLLLVVACVWATREHWLETAPEISAVVVCYFAADIFRQYLTKCEMAALRQKLERLEDRT